MNAYMYIKFGENKRETKFWSKSRAITLVQFVRKIMCNNPKVDHVNINTHTKFG